MKGPAGGVYVAISDEIGGAATVLLVVLAVAGIFLWGYLKEKGYLLHAAAAGVLIMLIIIQLLGPQKLSNFLFLGAILGWVFWKMDSDKGTAPHKAASIHDTPSTVSPRQDNVELRDIASRSFNFEEAEEKIHSARQQKKGMHLSIRIGIPNLLFSSSSKLCKDIESLMAKGVPEDEAIRKALRNFII